MRRFIFFLFTFFALSGFLLNIAYAQPSGGGPGAPPPVPITGIEYLLAAGAALGIRQFVKKKKDKS